MNVNEIRAKYWKAFARIEKMGVDKTLNRELAMLQVEMLTEIAAQACEIKEILARSVGLVNFEQLALQLTVLLDAKPKEKKRDEEKEGAGTGSGSSRNSPTRS